MDQARQILQDIFKFPDFRVAQREVSPMGPCPSFRRVREEMQIVKSGAGHRKTDIR